MILSIYLFLGANLVATIFAYYQKCYESLSLCLITNTDEGMEFRLNRSSAERWCKAHSSSLATITNVTVQSAIATFINDARLDRSTDVITNGYRYNLSGWKWTNGARSDLDHGHGFRYACLFVSNSRPYLSVCSHTFNKVKFICTYKLSKTSGSSCSQGYVRTGTICYKIHQQKAAWFEARSLCRREDGSDLAVFDEGLPSIRPTSNESAYYWIGLRTEKWAWWDGQGYDEVVNYSNWDGWSPSSSGGNCLCVRTSTGEWTNCDCSQNNRFICIQDYATGSALTFKPSTKKITTQTPTHTLDDNPRNDVSEDPHGTGQTSVIVLSTLIVLVVLIVVITAVVSAIVIKKRRKRSTRQDVLYVNNAFQPTSSVDDYTTLKRECLTGNETYAELNVYETIEDEIYKNSK